MNLSLILSLISILGLSNLSNLKLLLLISLYDNNYLHKVDYSGILIAYYRLRGSIQIKLK